MLRRRCVRPVSTKKKEKRKKKKKKNNKREDRSQLQRHTTHDRQSEYCSRKAIEDELFESFICSIPFVTVGLQGSSLIL